MIEVKSIEKLLNSHLHKTCADTTTSGIENSAKRHWFVDECSGFFYFGCVFDVEGCDTATFLHLHSPSGGHLNQKLAVFE